jgi:hypothetical protein
MNNAASWNVTPFGSCKNGRFGGTYRLHRQGENNPPSSLIFFTLVMEAILSAETSVLMKSHTAPRHRPQPSSW